MGLKKIYQFSSADYVSDPDALEVLGSRGLRIFELASIKAPIAPGFIILNEAIRDDPIPVNDIAGPLSSIETIMGKQFGGLQDPLLVKVAESPMLNLVNTLSTVHNVGLCDATISGFANLVGEDFAYHEYANLLQRILKLEMTGEIPEERRKKIRVFIDQLEHCVDKANTVEVLRQYGDIFPPGVYSDVQVQLMYVINLFQSLFGISDTRQDSCLVVQSMVFGNYGDDSGFGNYYTHDVVKGDSGIYGYYYPNAFDARGAQKHIHK